MRNSVHVAKTEYFWNWINIINQIKNTWQKIFNVNVFLQIDSKNKNSELKTCIDIKKKTMIEK